MLAKRLMGVFTDISVNLYKFNMILLCASKFTIKGCSLVIWAILLHQDLNMVVKIVSYYVVKQIADVKMTVSILRVIWAG